MMNTDADNIRIELRNGHELLVNEDLPSFPPNVHCPEVAGQFGVRSDDSGVFCSVCFTDLS